VDKSMFENLIGEYGWLFLTGVIALLFQSTIQEAVDGLMVFLGNDYNEDDVVEVDGDPGRIVRVGMWKTTFFIYHVVGGNIVGGSKLVVANSKLKDLKIEKPLPNLDLTKYKSDD
jgi:small-conductance mechanosensitive channel